MKKLSQTGFAAVEALLIVVILGIIGGTGYFVWHAKQNSDKSLDAANRSEQAKFTTKKVEAKKADTSQDGDACVLEDGSKGVTFPIGDNVFSFCQPNGWTLYHTEVAGAYFAPYDSIQYSADVKPALKATGGSDRPYEFFVQNTIGDKPTGYDVLTPRKTTSGYTMAKYYHLTGADDSVGAGIDNLPAGTKQYIYLVAKDDKRLVFTYKVSPEQTDNNKLIEAVVASTK